MKYIILGAGRQGLAIGYDLLKYGEASQLTLVDISEDAVQAGAKRLRRMVPAGNIHALSRNVPGKGIVGLLKGYDACVSAVPYRLNPTLAKAALQAKTNFCDLGGNTTLVKEALKLRPAARAAGVTIVPDCGLAPGLANVLAQMLVNEVPNIRDIRIRCGGLPVRKIPPLDYALLFSIEGLTNEYRGKAAILRGGKIKQVEAFTEREPFRGPPMLGPMECFFTSGGTTTAPWRLRTKLRSYEYKTVRYKGHFEKVRTMIDLGLLSLDPVDVRGRAVAPRDAFHAAAGPKLDHGTVKDLAILRVDGTDAKGRGSSLRMLQWYDRKTGFTAMEQGTGYPTAVVAHDLARGALKPGARTPDMLGYGREHLAALRKRGLKIKRVKLGGTTIG